ncbi:MAG TPA: hypothetical protein VNX66_09415 [Candidatus Sulfotelmatobacter sp.]|nr:hypothetical protein [Candidatus Sulfotelmatobacter sp.]
MKQLAGKSGARVDLKTMAMIFSWWKKSELSREECQEIESDMKSTLIWCSG